MPFVQVVLETERLVLRRFTSDDVGLIEELHSDPAVMRFINGGLPTPRDRVVADVLPTLCRTGEHPLGYAYQAAHERATGTFVGWFELRGTGPQGIELGYRLRAAGWGRGYATEGSLALVDRAFESGAHRIFACTMTVNTGSRRVMEKTGLRYLRTFHEDWPESIPGSEHGEVEYALTREDWLESRRDR